MVDMNPFDIAGDFIAYEEDQPGIYFDESKKYLKKFLTLKSLYDIILSFFSDDYLLKSINQNLKTLRRKYNREKFHTKFIKLINN